MRRFIIFSVLLLFLQQTVAAQTAVSITVDGSINPSSEDFIHNSLSDAANEKAECIIIHLNTPGGLLDATRQIVRDILQSPVPVIVYVSPEGAHAGSAGVFVTLAAHIAAMAPGTNIGAAHPVAMQGSMDSVMNEKGTNDAAAFIKTIADKRKRNVEWAENAVRNSVSITEIEALSKNVVDIIAYNDRDLLKKIDGRQVEVPSGIKTLQTKNAVIKEVEMGFFQKVLNILSDPNLAYILMMLGFYGILFELYSPGTILPGIVGVISLILAFYSMQTLPVNYAGLALIIFAVVLFILEIKIISHGMLAAGGIVSLFLGSVILFRSTSTLEIANVSWSVIITFTVLTALFFLFLIAAAIKAQRIKPVTGTEGFIGSIGEANSILSPKGTVRIHGEIWNAESSSGVINEGEAVRVTALKDLTLIVTHI